MGCSCVKFFMLLVYYTIFKRVQVTLSVVIVQKWQLQVKVQVTCSLAQWQAVILLVILKDGALLLRYFLGTLITPLVCTIAFH